jgi:hypothetical protein
MATNTLYDYTCFDNNDGWMTETDSLAQILFSEEEKYAPHRKLNVRKAIEKYSERKRLKRAISDYIK